MLSEDGIQIEAQTVNSKYKFGSEMSEQKASGSGIDDKQDIKAEDGSRAMTIQEDERKTSLIRADQEVADQLMQGPVTTQKSATTTKLYKRDDSGSESIGEEKVDKNLPQKMGVSVKVPAVKQ